MLQKAINTNNQIYWITTRIKLKKDELLLRNAVGKGDKEFLCKKKSTQIRTKWCFLMYQSTDRMSSVLYSRLNAPTQYFNCVEILILSNFIFTLFFHCNSRFVDLFDIKIVQSASLKPKMYITQWFWMSVDCCSNID